MFLGVIPMPSVFARFEALAIPVGALRVNQRALCLSAGVQRSLIHVARRRPTRVRFLRVAIFNLYEDG